MDDIRNHMEKIRVLFSSVASLLEKDGLRCVRYIGPLEMAPTAPAEPFLRLLLITDGCAGRFSCGGECFDIGAGSAAVCLGCPVDWPSVLTGASGWCMDIELSARSVFAPFMLEPVLLRFDVCFFEWMKSVFRTASTRCNLEEEETGRACYGKRIEPDSLRGSHRLAVQASLLELMTTFLSAIEVIDGEVRPLRSAAVQDALDFMASQYNDPVLSLDDIAQAAHLSEQQFGRRFREEMGVSPMQYLRSVRMRQAAALLVETALPVGEVALRAGISDALHFSKLFRKEFGRSPTQYRADRS